MAVTGWVFDFAVLAILSVGILIGQHALWLCRADVRRQSAQRKLRETEQRWRSTFEQAAVGIAHVALNGRWLRVNQKLCDIVQYNRQELLQLTFQDITHSEDLDADLQYVQQMLRSEIATYSMEKRYLRKDGSPIWIELTVSLVREPDGVPLYFISVVQDINQRKKDQDGLRQANARLAKSQEELLRALADVRESQGMIKAAHLRLMHAEKMDSVGTLAAGVAHEVRNPLAVVQLGLEVLRAHVSAHNTEARGVLKDMHEAVGRADRITRGLLDFSARGQPERQPHALNRVIERALLLVRHEVHVRRIHVDKDLATTLPLTLLDPIMIEQVFLNLMVNAIHAMPQGGTLFVRTSPARIIDAVNQEGSRRPERFHRGDPTVVAEVADTGPGIPVETLPKIFDPFFTTKSPGEGTGLGLYMARRIVELHGGLITIHNRPEGGALVRVTLKSYESSGPIPASS